MLMFILIIQMDMVVEPPSKLTSMERGPLDYLLDNKAGLRVTMWERCIRFFQSVVTGSTQPLLGPYLRDTTQRKHQVTIHRNKKRGRCLATRQRIGHRVYEPSVGCQEMYHPCTGRFEREIY